MVNYRSVKNIVGISAKLIDNNKIRNKKDLLHKVILKALLWQKGIWMKEVKVMV